MNVLKVVVLAVFLWTSVALKAQNHDMTQPMSTQGYKIGDVASDFNLLNIDGDEISLSSMPDAHGYIVVFTSNVCPFALLYEDRLIALHNKMAPKGYAVIAINSNDPEIAEGDSYEAMQSRAKEKDFPFVYLKDDKQIVYPKFGATKTPHVFLLDQDLKVQYIGAIDDNAQSAEDVEVKYVENAIAALESGKAVNPNMTKAIGCPIKSKNSMAKGGGLNHDDRKGPPSPEKILEMMDGNKDQKISKSEVRGRLAEHFDQLDKNTDGFLTVEELSAMKGKRPTRREM